MCICLPAPLSPDTMIDWHSFNTRISRIALSAARKWKRNETKRIEMNWVRLSSTSGLSQDRPLFPLFLNSNKYKPIAKTCGGSSPSDLPLYRLIATSEYKSLISLYGFSAIKIFATYVCKSIERIVKVERDKFRFRMSKNEQTKSNEINNKHSHRFYL